MSKNLSGFPFSELMFWYNVSNMAGAKSQRKEPIEGTKIAVWAAAAGRCTFCNRYVLENEDLGELVPIGELAHNVGVGEKSPRGVSTLDEEQRREADNLVLLCRNCHKPVDDKGVVGRYTVEEMARLKREHEKRIRFLTEIDADRQATIVRVVGRIRDFNPELTYDTVLGATTAAGLLPTLLPGAHRAEYERDLRQAPHPGSTTYFSRCAEDIDDLVSRIEDGIRHDEVKRLAVFGFARIPLLIHLGAKLDDKVPTIVFQRQRVDDINAWRWPVDPPEPPLFESHVVRPGSDMQRVALLINLSGVIRPEELPELIDDTYSVYSITPATPAAPGPLLFSSPAALTNFDASIRQFLVQIEAKHGKIPRISLFPAVPLSAAITLGRVLMPHVSPAWTIFDRDDMSQFFEALEVRR